VTPLAGAYTPFVLRLSRPDGSQRLQRIEATLPAGELANLSGVPYCSDQALDAAADRSGRAEQSEATCPRASRVGTVDVGVGAGAHPYHVSGAAYLAGPYRGAPLSLAIVTPAVAGPFDLGSVVVRTALRIDPVTARVHALSDPIPAILQGIPLDIRSVALALDRPHFSLNPTSCEPLVVDGRVESVFGQATTPSSRFQVGGCRGLRFRPSLHLALEGSIKRTAHPRLIASLTAAQVKRTSPPSVSSFRPRPSLTTPTLGPRAPGRSSPSTNAHRAR